MKRRVLLSSLLLVILLVTGCGSEEPTATPEVEPTVEIVPTMEAEQPTAEPEPTAPVVLELVGPTETKSLTMDDLKGLPTVEGWGGGKSSTGRITPPELHKGVTLQELCAQVGGLEPGQGASVVAKDGYAMTYSYDQIVNGEFITYDPGTGDEMAIEDPLQVIVACERSGQPIPEDSDGPLRLAILSPQNNQVVDGHWTVKWVTQVAIKDMAEDWTLQLEGALAEEMDRATLSLLTARALIAMMLSW
jgi:DMSO/TMAO reductase YedYZ molybdopterin-dependent catalytic subunit